MSRTGDRWVITILALLGAFGMAWPAKPPRFEIRPGPTELSPQEAAIVADPERFLEHGVVLVDETDWREDMFTLVRHVRAKILSAEGRSLGDVSLPAAWGTPEIHRWWGRTILPDGRVLELPKEGLERLTVAKDRMSEITTVRAALPGVEPGCVIDYGYEVRFGLLLRERTVTLQGDWPVVDWRLRWQPHRRLPAKAVLNRAEGLAITFESDSDSILVTGKDLPAVREEPYMPPLRERRASVTLFYLVGTASSPEQFWAGTAKRLGNRLRVFLADERATERAIAAMQLDPEQDLDVRLRAAYGWLGDNVDYRPLRTSEEQELDDEDPRNSKDHNTWVLEHRQATAWQLDALYIGIARALGARAELVLVKDRQKGFWWEKLMDRSQFDDAVVALDLPGRPRELVDPGSGLPYGQIPWWYTGATGVLFREDGYEKIDVPGPDTTSNTTFGHAEVRFVDDNEAWQITWSREHGPQAGLLERRLLRQKHPEERADRLRELCGESNDLEILEAEAPELDRVAGPLRIECHGESATDPIDKATATFEFPIHGVWNPPLPELPEGPRVHPVLLDYPRRDRTELVVNAPDGFEPMTPPDPVAIESRFGSYTLEVERTENGFRVLRSVHLSSIGIDVDKYPSLSTYLKRVKRADAATVSFQRTGR